MSHRSTAVSIQGAHFCINGRPLNAGKVFRGMPLDGLLLNSRMVQGIFDDLNPQTRPMWDYPDGPWDAERNCREFVRAMPLWASHGLNCFTINMQGGSPQGYSKEQPWINSAFTPAGDLRADYLARLTTILDTADRLGMVVILGLFYFGQEPKMESEAAVIRAVDQSVDYLAQGGWSNVVIEIANECNIHYVREIIRPERAPELIERVKRISQGRFAPGPGRLLVSTSFTGGYLPPDPVIGASDFVLLHGNGQHDPAQITALVDKVRTSKAYTLKPIVFNEDDHFDFDKPENNFIAAVRAGAGWGYFDYRMKGETFADGFQSMPADWGIGSSRKRAFFDLLRDMTRPAH